MLRCTVTFQAAFRDSAVSFPSLDIDPKEPSVEKVELASDGKVIVSTVHLSGIPSEETGRAIAERVNAVLLNRLAFHRGIVLEKARRLGDQFFPLINPSGGHHLAAFTGYFTLTGSPVRMVASILPGPLKAALELPALPHERYYGLYFSARRCESPAEEYMHLYNVLLMLFGDSQNDVDAFIVTEEPGVPQSQHPKKKLGMMETAFTRLRNEFAHQRHGVNLDTTKQEMQRRVPRLADLVKRAIELQP